MATNGPTYICTRFDCPSDRFDRSWYKPKITNLEKDLIHKFTFDEQKAFPDVQIFCMQNQARFEALGYRLQLPKLGASGYEDLISLSNSEDFDFSTERLLQRRFCDKNCYWKPDECFFHDNHSGKLVDLMKKDYHEKFNPSFWKGFENDYTPKLDWDNTNSYPQKGLDKLIDEDLGIWSQLSYDDNGISVNFSNLSEKFRNYGDLPYLGRPFYIFEMKRMLDCIMSLYTSTKKIHRCAKKEMNQVYRESFQYKGSLRKPILSQMMWGPMPFNTKDQPDENYICKHEDLGVSVSFTAEDYKKKKIHKCKSFSRKHFYMFSHSSEYECHTGEICSLFGPAMTRDLCLVYPCNIGQCNKFCQCNFCLQRKECSVELHKKHLATVTFNKDKVIVDEIDMECKVQKLSQCQEHWINHPENFNKSQDIEIEKNLFFHNGKIVDAPRNTAVEILKFAGIKKSCKVCTNDVKNHFGEHMVFHSQCKYCLFEMREKEFWERICNICQKNMANFSKQQIKRHKAYHKKGFFECQYCGLKTRSKSNLIRHLKESHAQNESTDEDMSDIEESENIAKNDEESDISDSESCPEARNSDSDSEPTEYDEDDQDDEDNSVFTKHPYQMKLKPKTPLFHEIVYYCRKCNKRYSYERNYWRHVNTEHGENIKYTCDKCKKSFRRKDNLSRHQFEVHGNIGYGKYAFPGTTIKLDYNCEICGAKFRRNGYLKRHVHDVHDCIREYNCEQCNGQFRRKEHLKRHEYDVHVNEKKYICEHCNKKFGRKETLKRHEQEVHAKEDYICEFCNDTFTKKVNLTRHQLNEHESGQIEYVCQQCDRKFKRRDNFERHSDTHKNIRECKECGRTFVENGDYKLHIALHKNLDKTWVPNNDDVDETCPSKDNLSHDKTCVENSGNENLDETNDDEEVWYGWEDISSLDKTWVPNISNEYLDETSLLQVKQLLDKKKDEKNEEQTLIKRKKENIEDEEADLDKTFVKRKKT